MPQGGLGAWRRPVRARAPAARGRRQRERPSYVLKVLDVLEVLKGSPRAPRLSRLPRLPQGLRIVSGPFCVRARIVGPPLPSVVVMRFSRARPMTVIGNPIDIGPLVVPVSSCALYPSGT